MVHFVSGNMFDQHYDILVNTVNCVGVMGAGVALAFKKRYPDMFVEYKDFCARGWIRPGQIHLYQEIDHEIINFPTKRHWRDNSRYEDIQSGLKALRRHLEQSGTPKVALPALGCGHGGLDWRRVSRMIEHHLGDLDADIYVFEPQDSRNAGNRAKNERRK